LFLLSEEKNLDKNGKGIFWKLSRHVTPTSAHKTPAVLLSKTKTKNSEQVSGKEVKRSISDGRCFTIFHGTIFQTISEISCCFG